MDEARNWGALAGKFKRTTLTGDVLAELLGLSLPRATMLIGELAQVGVDTIGTLLTAAEFINPDNTLKPGAYLPATLHASILAAIAALRDRVTAGMLLAHTAHPAEHCK